MDREFTVRPVIDGTAALRDPGVDDWSRGRYTRHRVGHATRPLEAYIAHNRCDSRPGRLQQTSRCREKHVRSPQEFRAWQFEQLARIEAQIESEQRRVSALEVVIAEVRRQHFDARHRQHMLAAVQRTIGALEMERRVVERIIAENGREKREAD